MIIAIALVGQDGHLFLSEFLPEPMKKSIRTHADNFLDALLHEGDDVYIETSSVRYIYKQTDDLYWLLVTKLESDMSFDIETLGQFVCTIMEYGSSETCTRTLTEQQRDLYYQHLWRPWDEEGECPTCNCHCNSVFVWQREFENRLQLLRSMSDGHISDEDASYVSALIRDAWFVSWKLSPKRTVSEESGIHNSDSASQCSEEIDEISEDVLIDGCRLKCRLEDIRVELARIQDPYLRMFARRDLLNSSDINRSFEQGTAPSLSFYES